MHRLSSHAVRSQLDGIVHWPTQQADRGADLTAAAVYRLVAPGQLDFGGSEFAPADREAINPKRAHPDDDYGWWRLDAGTYLIRYNESLVLDTGSTARLFPLDRLLQAGAHHPTMMMDEPHDPLETVITVGDAGCHLKENCRISRLIISGQE